MHALLRSPGIHFDASAETMLAWLVQHLAEELSAHSVFLGEFSSGHANSGPGVEVAIRAAYAEGKHARAGQLPHEGTPCERLAGAAMANFTARGRRGRAAVAGLEKAMHWPNPDCAVMPVLGMEGDLLGCIVVMFGESPKNLASVELILQMAALRTAAVLDHERIHRGTVDWEKRYRELRRQWHRQQEEDRKSISRNVHDEVGQVLTALKFSLASLMHLEPGEVARRVQELQKLLNDTIQHISDWSFNLAPALLEDLGLGAAVEQLLYFYRLRLQLEVDFMCASEVDADLDREVEIAAFRIIQEGLTNIAKHAGVSAATLRLSRDGGTLTVELADRGNGFLLDGRNAAGRRIPRGLMGMRERAESLGGEIGIMTSPGEGTRLSVRLPVKQKESV